MLFRRCRQRSLEDIGVARKHSWQAEGAPDCLGMTKEQSIGRHTFFRHCDARLGIRPLSMVAMPKREVLEMRRSWRAFFGVGPQHQSARVEMEPSRDTRLARIGPNSLHAQPRDPWIHLLLSMLAAFGHLCHVLDRISDQQQSPRAPRPEQHARKPDMTSLT